MTRKRDLGLRIALVVLAVGALTACRSAYYALWEQVGKEKRHLLRDEVDLAVDCRPHPHPAVHRTELFREKYGTELSDAEAVQHCTALVRLVALILLYGSETPEERTPKE